MHFSEEIEERTKAYFERRFGYVLTDVQAQLALTQLATLATVLTDVAAADRTTGSSRGDRREGCVAPRGGHAEKSQSHGDTDHVAQYHQSASVDSSEN